ncbi:Cysteine-rich CPCC [Anaerocolumna jejuensis DSM 15929]|uniref:Cysteine-rich CPCC n=1 Tax=Anaerocolumna jejuensis DSM 15929 TaxID=1121322 RepID=A0A1M6QU25_9FIRM|nr:CPCC family cysteine-rich protein [Anaerocolumna jejuensis]SHK23610.1 Cysteine-rich CPCC [Anaerocolumna jejuensis DSM 15929]
MKNISRENALKLIDEIRSTVEKEIDLSKYLEESFLENNIEQTELEAYSQGISNGFLSEIVHAIIGYEVEVIGEVEELFPCPCCGFKTLTELYDLNEGTGYDICPYCKWEDDGTTEINMYRPINKGSLQDYRNNIQANLNKYYINKWFIK